jgi:hypothetical protein
MTQAEINADRERTVAIYKAGKAERDATVAKMAADAAAAKARANAADAKTQAKVDAAAALAQTKWLAEVAAREQAQKQAPVVVAPAPNVVPVVDTTTVVVPAVVPSKGGNVYKISHFQVGTRYIIPLTTGGKSIGPNYKSAIDNSRMYTPASDLSTEYYQGLVKIGADVYDLGPIPPASDTYSEPWFPKKYVPSSPVNIVATSDQLTMPSVNLVDGWNSWINQIKGRLALMMLQYQLRR